MHALLITGGAGFIGSNFVQYRLNRYPGRRVVVLDALTYAGNPENLAPVAGRPELRFVHGNICEIELIETLLREERVDTIVNFAAESHVDRSIKGPDAFIETNIVGTHSLLKAARTVWLQERSVGSHRFHQVSTDEVYGTLGPNDPGFHERTPYAPNSPYSASKAASDHLVRAYHHTYGLQITTSNCTNNYGPYQFPEKLVPLIIINTLYGHTLPIYGDGCNVRDWLHVEDHCLAIDLILQKGRPGEVYNIGGGAECRNIDLVHSLCEMADEVFRDNAGLRSEYPHAPAARGERTSSLIQFVNDRPGHDRRYAVDCRKAMKELDYRASVPLRTGLRKTFDWYLQQEHWWRALMARRSAMALRV